MIGTLYIVATPIGNLQDITIRAAKLLTSIDIVACEDTRHTGILLEHLRNTYLNNPLASPKPRLVSYYDQEEERKVPELLEILQSGKDIALVSDAGTPLLSDPGFRIVRACREQHIPVVAIPGATSVVAALVSSGLPTDKFTFLGYPPKKEGHAKTFFKEVKNAKNQLPTTIIFFEAPHKILKTLELVMEIFGDINIVICRELTKMHEEVTSGLISEMLEGFKKKEPKGEMVVLFR